MQKPHQIHELLTWAVVGLFLVALVLAVSAGPSELLGTAWGVAVAALVLGGTLAIAYLLMWRRGG